MVVSPRRYTQQPHMHNIERIEVQTYRQPRKFIIYTSPMQSFIKATLFLLTLASVDAYNVQKPAHVQVEAANSRRALFRNVAAVAVGGAIASLDASPAIASGGATAGKYT